MIKEIEKHAGILLVIFIATLFPATLRAETLKLGSGEFNAQDATDVLQKAFSSGAEKVIITRQNGPWLVKTPLVLSGNRFRSYLTLPTSCSIDLPHPSFAKERNDKEDSDGSCL